MKSSKEKVVLVIELKLLKRALVKEIIQVGQVGLKPN